MDSPHLLHLGFLLLAFAAPRPNIAMSNVGPAEWTEDFSSGSTTVAVYHCKDCKSSTCKSRASSFENFQKIAETQNQAFSDVAIELVTNETHITVCFKQANSCLEGIYGVFWKKAGGAGLSCGILNSEGFFFGNTNSHGGILCHVAMCESHLLLAEHTQTQVQPQELLCAALPSNSINTQEHLSSFLAKLPKSGIQTPVSTWKNGRGTISTEKTICCEAETDIWRHNPTLKCYTQKSRPKPTTLPVGIPEEILGNPEFLTSNNNSFIILFALLVAAVLCTGCAITYYIRRRRRRQGFRQGRQFPDTEILAHP